MAQEWSTPHVIDLKDTPTLLLQCERSFVSVDSCALPPAHYRVILLFMPACVA